MSEDKELEIRLQFLNEAQEYLDTLESRLLGITQGLEGETINEALRAAHSIKGGAALMGFQILSDFAHRLEDGLKVLKVKRSKIEIDASLEQQLLLAVDCMSHVMGCTRQGLSKGQLDQISPDQHWLDHSAEPIFVALHERLGDPEEEDAQSMLSPEDDQDIVPMLFQSEVEGCLERLEGVINEQSPCLREEIEILAQELGGLGEMLQLESFIQLCQSISHCISIANDSQITDIANSALEVWRRTQALVLTGNIDSIPADFDPGDIDLDEDITAPLPQPESLPTVLDSEIESEPLAVETFESSESNTWLDQGTPTFINTPDVTLEPAAASNTESPDTFIDHSLSLESDTEPPPDWSDLAELEATDWGPPPQPEPSNFEQSFQKSTLDLEDDDDDDSTVRVPVKQINQLGDMFGELTIERNRLELEVKRLRDLVGTMKSRMRTLDQVNSDLRNAYDRVATQSESPQKLISGSEPQLEILSSDELSQQFDALEMDRYRDLHLPFREVIETIVQLQEVGADIDLSLDGTEQTTRNLRKTARQLQKSITQLRMRPLSDVFERFPRALRQMSLQHDKPVELKVLGGRTLVDRNVLESLQEPLMHLIRNCFDHGIEAAQTRESRGKPATGEIAISAHQQSGRTFITIRDDGGGIAIDKIRERARRMGLDDALLNAASDQELLSLIFEPGFSTASQVTDLSGRGVGMDVVRSKLKEVRGDIQVQSEPGVGTTFTISIPFTLSVTRVLIAESHGMRMAFPVDAIVEMFVLSPDQVLTTAGKESFNWEGEIVQLVRLADWLHFNCPTSLESPEVTPTISSPTVLLVSYNQRWVGIQVDRSWGEQEVALRRVAGNLSLPVGFNSCTILGDGQVVPLISVPDMLYWIASCEASGTSPLDAVAPALMPTENAKPAVPKSRKPTVLLVDDSINVRRLLALTLEKAGYQVAQAKDGQDALDKLIAGLEVKAVICDVEMPRLDGYGFLARLKAQTQFDALPVAMLTSRGSKKHRELAMNLGATAYFTKPYNERNLLQTLDEMIQPALVN